VNSHFFRFPHTPHLAWLSDGPVRGDKIFTPQEIDHFLAKPVAIEEKVDGANIGFSLDPDGLLQVQQRGGYLQPPFMGQFKGLTSWLVMHSPSMEAFLHEPQHRGLILFGEWCAARHSLAYNHLPDPFLLFDIADPHQQRFWSRPRRNATADQLGIAIVPLLQDNGHHSIEDLRQEIHHFRSHYHPGAPEGVILRQDDPSWCLARAKLVRADFSQAIDDHWRSRPLEWNGIDYSIR